MNREKLLMRLHRKQARENQRLKEELSKVRELNKYYEQGWLSAIEMMDNNTKVIKSLNMVIGEFKQR